MIRKVIPFRNFPHRFFAVVAVFALVAFLLTLKPVAEQVKKLVEMLGITFPPLDVFRATAANFLLLGIGVLLLPIAAIIVVASVKVAVVVVAVAIIGVALYNLYNTFTGKSTVDLIPQGTPMTPKA
jgi:hypothetical protein